MNRRDATTSRQPFKHSAQGMLLGPASLHSPEDILAEIEAEIDRRYRKQDKHARQERAARGAAEPEAAVLLTRRRR